MGFIKVMQIVNTNKKYIFKMQTHSKLTLVKLNKSFQIDSAEAYIY